LLIYGLDLILILLSEWLRAANFEIKEITEQETHSYFKIIAIKATKKGGHHVRNN
jgi:hypothetical protein